MTPEPSRANHVPNSSEFSKIPAQSNDTHFFIALFSTNNNLFISSKHLQFIYQPVEITLT